MIEKLTRSAQTLIGEISQRSISETLIDVVKYYPRGLNPEITTDDGIRLSLNGLSPVTIGRYRMGDTELPEQRLISAIPENTPVVEIGAGVGYITMHINKRTNEKYIAVEASRYVFLMLQKAKELNDANFQPLNVAYYPTEKEVSFPITNFFKTATIGDNNQKTATVTTMSLEEMVSEFEVTDFHLHVDIEGAEELLLHNEMDIITENAPTISMEFHRNRVTGLDKLIAKITEHFNEIGREGVSERPVILFERKETDVGDYN